MEEYLFALVAGKLGNEKQELPEHSPVYSKNGVGLWKVTDKVFEILCIAEQIFKTHTQLCSNKIDSKLITVAEIEYTGVLANSTEKGLCTKFRGVLIGFHEVVKLQSFEFGV